MKKNTASKSKTKEPEAVRGKLVWGHFTSDAQEKEYMKIAPADRVTFAIKQAKIVNAAIKQSMK